MRVKTFGQKRIWKVIEPLKAVGVSCDDDGPYDAVISDVIKFIPLAYLTKLFKGKKNCKIVYRIRGDIWKEKPQEGGFTGKLILLAGKLFFFRLCNFLMPVSHYLGKRCKENGENNIKVCWIPYVNIPPNKEEGKHIVTITNFEYWDKIKPLFEYINIVNKVASEYNIKWKIAGKGKYLDKFLNLIEDYNNVDYVGYVNPENFYKEGCVMLHLSELECMSATTIEAMLAELPVIANNFPAFLEFNYIHQINDKKELYDTLIKFMEKPLLRHEIGILSRKYALKEFNLKKIGNEMVNCLNDVQN